MAYTTIDECRAEYAIAKKNGDAAGMQLANNKANEIRARNGQAAQYAAGDIQSVASANAGKAPASMGYIESGRQQSSANYASGLNASNIATDKAVEGAVANLEARKSKIQQTGKDNNTAAYDVYMQTINDYGASQEALAARGLQSSGLSESSKISAGNTYQSALNRNARQVTEQLAEVDLAIEQARLNGDMTKAQQLSDYYNALAALSYTAGGDKAGAFQADRNYDRSVLESDRNYNRNVLESDRAYNYELALGNAEALAAMGDFSGYQKLYGWTDAQTQAYKAYWLSQQAAADGSGGRSAGSSRRGNGGYSAESNDVSLQKDTQKEAPPAENAFVNSVQYDKSGDVSKIYVSGYGWMTPEAVEDYVNTGEIFAKTNNTDGKTAFLKTAHYSGTKDRRR